MIVSTTEVLTWRIDGGYVDMPAGTRLEILPWTDHEQDHMRDRVAGFVAVTWHFARRWVPARALKPTCSASAKSLKAALAAGKAQAAKVAKAARSAS